MLLCKKKSSSNKAGLLFRTASCAPLHLTNFSLLEASKESSSSNSQFAQKLDAKRNSNSFVVIVLMHISLVKAIFLKKKLNLVYRCTFQCAHTLEQKRGETQFFVARGCYFIVSLSLVHSPVAPIFHKIRNI